MSCRSRVFTAVACLALLAAMAPGASASESAEGSPVFSPAVFSPEEDSLTGVWITALPEGGSLLLGRRVIRPGDVLTAQQLSSLTFQEDDSQAEAVIRYLPVFADRVASEASLSIPLTKGKNEAPIALDSAMETYKNLPNEGLLKVSDPEQQPMTYTLTRQPRRGQVILREDGSFLYTPEKNKVGTDSFTYTAADPAGNVSREATVTVRILKPSDQLQYSDTEGLSCRFSAEWLRCTGIFSGEQIGDQLCFSPDEPVTRGQFLAMLMRTLELPVDNAALQTGFVDAAPPWLRPCLAAALRCGLITGYAVEGGVEFRPDHPITGEEAAVMLQKALDFTLPAQSVWARDVRHQEASGAGLVMPEGDITLTRADTAELFYAVSKLRFPLESTLSR